MNSTRRATASQPSQVSTAPGNFIVETVPVFSAATIISITNDGSTSIMNCTVNTCGLAAGNQVELGEALAVGTNCEGPHTISAVSGNTASFSSTSCAASAGPYPNTIGQWAPALALSNAVAASDDVVQFLVNYEATGANVQIDTLLQCSPTTNITFTAMESGTATYAVTVNLILN